MKQHYKGEIIRPSESNPIEVICFSTSNHLWFTGGRFTVIESSTQYHYATVLDTWGGMYALVEPDDGQTNSERATTNE